MTVKKENKQGQVNIKQIKLRVEQEIEMAQALNNLTSVRILLLLWAHKEQSINDLCEKLGKSWPTVTKHLEKLEATGILEVREERARGPKNKKMYSVKPEILSFTRLNFNLLNNLSPTDVLEIISRDLISDAKTIDIFKKIFDDIIPYYGELERTLREMKDPTIRQLEEFYIKKHVNYYVEILDDEEFDFYYKKYKELLNELSLFKQERGKQNNLANTAKPFAILHMIAPIKEIQDARIKNIWKT